MRYLFATVTTNCGPAHFPVVAGDHESGCTAARRECHRRGVHVISIDKIEPLSADAFAELWDNRPPAVEEATHYRYVYRYHPDGHPECVLTDDFVSNEQLTAAKAWRQAEGEVSYLPGWHTVVKVSEVMVVEIDNEVKKPC